MATQPRHVGTEEAINDPEEFGRLVMVGLRTVLVEEGVSRPGVVVELDVLAQLLQPGLELPRRLGREVVVGPGPRDRGRPRPAWSNRARVRPRDEPVRRNDGLDGVGALGSEHQGQPPTHAEPDDPHLRPRPVRRCSSSTAPLRSLATASSPAPSSACRPRRARSVARWSRGRGRRGSEPGLGEPVDGVLDLVDQAPPLLQHDDSRRGRRPVGSRDIALDGAPIARKFDDFTHAADGSLPRRSPAVIPTVATEES